MQLILHTNNSKSLLAYRIKQITYIYIKSNHNQIKILINLFPILLEIFGMHLFSTNYMNCIFIYEKHSPLHALSNIFPITKIVRTLWGHW